MPNGNMDKTGAATSILNSGRMGDQSESRCLKCGECCRNILHLLPKDALVKDKRVHYKDRQFIKNHWHEIEPPEKMNRFTPDYAMKKLHHYRCDMVQADGTCGAYEDRPNICRDYPPKDVSGLTAIQGLISDRCGFMPKGARRG